MAAIMATLAELELELGRERRAVSRESRRTRQLPSTKAPRSAPTDKSNSAVSPPLANPSVLARCGIGVGRATAYRYLSGYWDH